MAELDPNIIIEISTKIAAIDERTKSSEKNADQRHGNILEAIRTFVPRNEIDQMIDHTRAYAETLANSTRQHCDMTREAVVARVEKVEEGLDAIHENGKWLKRAFISAAITAGLALGAYVYNVVFVLKIASH